MEMIYNQNFGYDNYSAKGSCHGPFQNTFRILVPKRNETIETFFTVQGIGAPNAEVTIRLDCLPPLETRVSPWGIWAITVPYDLDTGTHKIMAVQCCCGTTCCDDVCFYLDKPDEPLGPPTIDTPPDGAVIEDRRPFIEGTADPGNKVTVCLLGLGCQQTTAGEDGRWRVQFGFDLEEQGYTITATQEDEKGNVSPEADSRFTVRFPIIIEPPTIDRPSSGAVIHDCYAVIEGTAQPGNTVVVCLSGHGCLEAAVRQNGVYQVPFPNQLTEGFYTVTAYQRDASGNQSDVAQGNFTVEAILPVPAPTIEIPENGSVISNPRPYISGLGEPGYNLEVCIATVSCIVTRVDEQGEYHIQYPQDLPDGSYTITATQSDCFGNKSQAVTSQFRIATGDLLLEPVTINRGSSFRTVDLTFYLTGTPGNATVYYIMRKAPSTAPGPEEMINPSEVKLSDGTEARGYFTVDIPQDRVLFQRTVKGREVPDPYVLETGAVDGINYDVYLYAVVSPLVTSGVVTFGEHGMAMPFDGGDGSAAAPYIIRELTAAELTEYPDLKEGHPINITGTDQPARMLQNIERLEVLYDETDGAHGMEDSLAQNYSLTSSFDLNSYAAAYNGDGWQPIGNIDASYYGAGPTGRHIFTGTLTGQPGGTIISNLSLTPQATVQRHVECIGLIGYASQSKVKLITIQNAVISPRAGDENGALWMASLAAIAKGCTLEDIAVEGAAITLHPFGQGQGIAEAGGLIGEFDNGSITRARSENVSITGDSVAYNYCGGVVGYAHGDETPSSITDSFVKSFTLSPVESFSVFAGGLIGLLMPRQPFRVENIKSDLIRIDTPRAIGGGVIGYILGYSDVSVSEITVSDAYVHSDFSSYSTGGVIGNVYCYGAFVLSSAVVSDADIYANYGAGGLIGHISFYSGTTGKIYDFTVTVAAAVTTSYAGGAIGYFYREGISDVNVYDGKVLEPSTVTGYNNNGGLVGDLFHTQANDDYVYIENCTSAAIVESMPERRHAGGLIGFGNYVAMKGCAFTGSVKSTAYTGGILGGGYAVYLEDCHVTGTVTGNNIVGGIMGNAVSSSILSGNASDARAGAFPKRDNVITRCSVRNTITIEGTGRDIGGIAGTLNGVSIEECFFDSNILQSGSSKIGLIAGNIMEYDYGYATDISNCYATGTIENAQEEAGGIAGSNKSSITLCYASRSVTGENNIGGIAGINAENGNISGCFALESLVSASNGDAARIANNTAVLTNNYAINSLQLLPGPAVDDSNGKDGGIVTQTGLTAAMEQAGFNNGLWALTSIATLGRPTLVNNPE